MTTAGPHTSAGPPAPPPGRGGLIDPANESLADALRTSFRILKLAMIVLVVLFLPSGTFVVEQTEQAIVLRMGKPVGRVREAGFNWAFPAPIDEVVKIPVKQSSTLTIDSHWLHLRENEKTIPLSQLRRGRKGLHPMRDGALLTSDMGLVHVQWRLTYRITDLTKYVTMIADTNVEKPDQIITAVLERSAIHVVSQFTTEEATRKRLTDMRDQLKVAINLALEEVGSGIVVESVAPKAIPPVQTRLAFDEVIRAENNKRTTIRDAEQKARQMLNSTAGAAHSRIIAHLDALDAARLAHDDRESARLEAEVDQMIEREATGRVGAMIRDAKSYYTSAVQRMRGDAEQYQTLLDEYRSQPEMLINRLWEKTKNRLFSNPGITKVYRPPGAQFRIRVGLDPRQREKKERDKYLLNLLPDEPLEFEVKIPGGPLTVP